MKNTSKNICPRCNYSGGSTDRICPYCGLSLISKCPVCSAPIRVVFAEYCHACGSSLEESAGKDRRTIEGGKR